MMNTYAALAAVGLTLASSYSAGAQESVSIRLAWVKTAANAAPYYYAVDKGLYAAEGLNVTVLEGKGSPLSVQLVASGDVFIASADLAIVAKAIEKDVPVRAVFGELQENAMAVLSIEPKGIKVPKDLEGKTILGSATTSYTKLLPALCLKTRIDCDKIKVRYVSPPFEPLMLAGQADGMLGLFTNAPKLEEQGAKVSILRYSDYGITTMANGLIVSEDTLKKRPETIRKFLRATALAWAAMRDRPDEVVDSWMKIIGSGDRATYARVAEQSVSIMHTKRSLGKPIGWMSPGDWKEMLDTLKSVGELEQIKPLERYYTNQFVE